MGRGSKHSFSLEGKIKHKRVKMPQTQKPFANSINVSAAERMKPLQSRLEVF